jgi:DNA-binding MarR family transcriptional regulator
MAWIYEKNSDGGRVCSTDLVRERRFGTLPTVTSNLNLLTTRGLLRTVVADDRRIKWLELTKAGEATLEQRAHLIAAAIAGP